MKQFNAGHICTLLTMMMTGTSALAFQSSGSLDLGVRHTDNATLVNTNEISDDVVTTQVSGSIAENNGSLTGSATASLEHMNWLDNTFGNQDYLDLASSATWEQIRNRLTWGIHDYYSQSEIDNLAANTPDNIQNVNAFGVSANASFPVADRHQLHISPAFEDYRYDDTTDDNQQVSLGATWAYQYRPTIGFSLNGSLVRVEYDNQPGFDYDSKSLNVGTSGSTARTVFSGSIGTTSVERDTLSDESGMSYSLNLKYTLTGRSSVVAHLASDLTDSSSVFLGSFIDPTTGNISNIQTSGDVVRNKILRVSYERDGSVIGTTIWTEQRELDYQSTPNDRDVHDYGLRFGYQVNQKISTSLTGSYTKTNETSNNVDLKDTTLGAGLGYRLSRKTSLNLDLTHQSRDSDVATDEYEELSVYAGIGYAFWP
jgi:hypothetical protein